MQNIQIESAIWDLHIHTCACPKASDEFRLLEKEEFIEKIIEIFNLSDNLDLFSFTDHNQISVEVYEEYIEQNGKTAFLVGVEQDIYFNSKEKEEIKHLVIYFDINKENFKDNIQFMKEYNDFVNKDKKSISDLLNFLVEKKKRFVLSPHAFKQDNKSIDFDWTTEDIVEKEAHKYTDQFFCFWEAQGYSAIAKAIEFLKAFELEEKISIIAFSDSNNFDKLNNYLENPYQWFCSLPNFKGLELIATENTRITTEKLAINSGNYGNLIGKVCFNDQLINFSNKLNCIIGGRGSGKSLLLDALANKLKKIELREERREYINLFTISVFNYSGNIIEENNFSFDYFKQSYVADLFDDNDYYQKIQSQFKEELSRVKDIEVEYIKNENKEFFLSNIIDYTIHDNLDNISDFINKYIILSDKSFNNSLKKQDKSKKKTIVYDFVNDFVKKIKKIIPNEISNDIEINDAILRLISICCEKVHEYNERLIDSEIIKNIMIDCYLDYKNGISTANKEKNQIEDLIKKTFENKGVMHSKRVNIINAYVKSQRNFENYYEEFVYSNGEIEDAFKIMKILKIETPFEYLIRLFSDYFYAVKIRKSNTNTRIDLDKAIKYYCFEKQHELKDGKSIEKLDEELLEFNLIYDSHPQILYLINDEYEDILNLSPGTQTNILMEYLVYKDTTKPILIDQPEDNVDNSTVYKKLRTWFKKLKNKRQVIVVTHDANIVINADAENIIVANHNKKDKFIYKNGALEYENNLEIASEILDGGKEAVKRRLMKYGE